MNTSLNYFEKLSNISGYSNLGTLLIVNSYLDDVFVFMYDNFRIVLGCICGLFVVVIGLKLTKKKE